MQEWLRFLAICLLVPFHGNSQDNDELIDWSPVQLTWADYKGSPDAGSDAAASTSTYLSIEYNLDEKGFSWKIQCRFSRTRSWGRNKTPYILLHEQGHFDIAEIYARKLQKKMTAYRFDAKSYQKDLKKIYDSVTEEKEAFQNTYDRETDHSRNREQQAAWQKKIREQLADLKEFSGY